MKLCRWCSSHLCRFRSCNNFSGPLKVLSYMYKPCSVVDSPPPPRIWAMGALLSIFLQEMVLLGSGNSKLVSCYAIRSFLTPSSFIYCYNFRHIFFLYMLHIQRKYLVAFYQRCFVIWWGWKYNLHPLEATSLQTFIWFISLACPFVSGLFV